MAFIYDITLPLGITYVKIIIMCYVLIATVSVINLRALINQAFGN